MSEEEIRQAVIELLYDLHNNDKLNAFVINSISRIFNIDAFELCEEQGITYFLN